MSTNHPNRTRALAEALMARPSITPNDGGCQAFIGEALAKLGFSLTSLPHGKVSNLWARWGDQAPLFVFAGHTDVVPTGELSAWTSPPFSPTEREGFLYGRGAVDMKGGIAAMISACETLLGNAQGGKQPTLQGSIAFLITSDEEGEAVDGTVKVVEWLQSQDITIDYCLVGEPSSDKQVGDTLRPGRRGSLNGELTVIGKQGHTAFPELAINPIHIATPFLLELENTIWDGPEHVAEFPSTSLQISAIQAGAGATNIIPGELSLRFNFRYAPPLTADQLKAHVTDLLKTHQLNYRLKWQEPNAQPFYTASDGKLIDACTQAVQKVSGLTPLLSTGGGTSDGRFIAPTGAEVVELGLCNATIHQINECVRLTDLETLRAIYLAILKQILSG